MVPPELELERNRKNESKPCPLGKGKERTTKVEVARLAPTKAKGLEKYPALEKE